MLDNILTFLVAFIGLVIGCAVFFGAAALILKALPNFGKEWL